jgi:tRNA pseudouridine55 synthase
MTVTMQPYLLDKPIADTPLDTLERLRGLRPELAGEKLAYAGRLDPMASGLLVVLHGPMLKEQEQYWNLPKEYTAQALLGWRSDSFDILGIPTPTTGIVPSPSRILTTLQAMVGKLDLSVPVFSSVVHDGIPLFAHAREGLAPDVQVPVRRMAVNQVDTVAIEPLSERVLRERIDDSVGRVRGNFRQDEILAAWHALLRPGAELVTVRFTLACAGGTYVRSVVHELGRRLGCGALLSELRRTRVGPWRVSDENVIRFGVR